AVPLAFAVVPVSMVAKGSEVTRCVVPDGIHPTFAPGPAENALVDPLFEMRPEEGQAVRTPAFALRDEIEKAGTPSLHSLGEPLGDVSFCTLNRADPERECLPGHVLLPRILQLSPRDGRRLPLRHLARHGRRSCFKFAGAPEALGFGLDHCGSNSPSRHLVPAI